MIANSWKEILVTDEVMKNKDIAIKEKRKVYNMCILPCLTYGCQTWVMSEKLMNIINVCQNRIERSVIGVKRKGKVRLREIKSITKGPRFKDPKTTYETLKW